MSERTGEQTRARILEVALDLFGRDGFDSTTVRAIAEGCGITDAALYYHFPSKQEILNALWSSFRSLGDTIGAQHQLTQRTLAGLVEYMIDGMAATDAQRRILVRGILSDDRTAQALRELNRASLIRTLLPLFQSVFEPEEAETRAEALLMLFQGIIYTAQIDHGPAFVQLCKERKFRDEVKRLVLLSVPLPSEAL